MDNFTETHQRSRPKENEEKRSKKDILKRLAKNWKNGVAVVAVLAGFGIAQLSSSEDHINNDQEDSYSSINKNSPFNAFNRTVDGLGSTELRADRYADAIENLFGGEKPAHPKISLVPGGDAELDEIYQGDEVRSLVETLELLTQENFPTIDAAFDDLLASNPENAEEIRGLQEKFYSSMDDAQSTIQGVLNLFDNKQDLGLSIALNDVQQQLSSAILTLQEVDGLLARKAQEEKDGNNIRKVFQLGGVLMSLTGIVVLVGDLYKRRRYSEKSKKRESAHPMDFRVEVLALGSSIRAVTTDPRSISAELLVQFQVLLSDYDSYVSSFDTTENKVGDSVVGERFFDRLQRVGDNLKDFFDLKTHQDAGRSSAEPAYKVMNTYERLVAEFRLSDDKENPRQWRFPNDQGSVSLIDERQ